MYRELYGGMESPTIPWFEQQVINGQRIVEILETHQLLSKSSVPLRVLEIGTGAGGALLPFMQRGDQTLGIDFDEDFLNFGRKFGLNLQVSGVDSLNTLGKFDLVILKDVLEHLPSPRETLLQVRECLSDHGLCFVQVPGLQALGYLGYRYDLRRYLQVAHVCHYTSESLSYLGESVGLTVNYSSRQGIVVYSRASHVPSRLVTSLPSPKIADDALRSIYLRRIPYAVRLSMSKPMPKVFKKFLRQCQTSLSRWRR
jgi:SAM-dependent methyltransferase